MTDCVWVGGGGGGVVIRMNRHSLIFQPLVCSDSLHLDPLPQGLFYQDSATPLLLYRAAKVRMTTSDSLHSTRLGAEVCTVCVV